MMELSAVLKSAAASVVAIGGIGGGVITLDHRHVASDDFKDYIQQQQEADDRAYVQELKKSIREVTGALLEDPDEVYLLEALASLIDELCEVRPDDRLCNE